MSDSAESPGSSGVSSGPPTQSSTSAPPPADNSPPAPPPQDDSASTPPPVNSSPPSANSSPPPVSNTSPPSPPPESNSPPPTSSSPPPLPSSPPSSSPPTPPPKTLPPSGSNSSSPPPKTPVSPPPPTSSLVPPVALSPPPAPAAQTHPPPSTTVPSSPPPVQSSPIPPTQTVSPPLPVSPPSTPPVSLTPNPTPTIPTPVPSTPTPTPPIPTPITPNPTPTTLPPPSTPSLTPPIGTSPSTPLPTPSTPSLTPPIGTSPPISSASNVSSPPSNRVPTTHAATNTNSSSEESSQSTGSSKNSTGPIVGVAIAGVAILALIAIFFVVSRRKKKKSGVIPAQYTPPQAGNYNVSPDGQYYGPPSMGMSGPYSSQHSVSPQGAGNNYGSQRGHMYYPGGPESGVLGGAKTFFTYEELMEMTNGFSQQNIIGEGGFGYVYKGWLPDGKAVAIKQLKAGSGQGEREFRAEVEIISRVHHRHLVSLVGYSLAENQRLLIFEFLPNKTLEHHLHGKNLPVLEWSKRVKIALGSARGLAYLHEDCNPKIIHRDIKSANILLDDDFEAQVADFGLARPSNDTHTHVSTRVMGTFGYLAPEYASSGKLTDRSDVFSFGVVLLELLTGHKPVDATRPLGDESLVEWARPLLIRALDTGDVGEVVDPRLEHRYVESEVLRMIETAAACVRHSAPKRPRMAQVVRALDTEGEMTDLSNGVKFGQSTIYEAGQYNQDMQRFRMMAFGDNSSDFEMYSGECHSTEVAHGAPNTWKTGDSTNFRGNEAENRTMNGK